MAELRLKSQQFRAEREADWRRLEYLLTKAHKDGAAKLRREELLEIPVLYSQTLSSLSVARAISLDQGLVDYLENLAARAYFFVYGVRSRTGERLANFFARDWPAAVRALWRETVVAAALTLGGLVAGYLMVSRSPSLFYTLVGSGMSQGRDPAASVAALRETIYGKASVHDALSLLATFLFTHNAQVAVFALALGFAFCVPTAGLMLSNGCMLGAMLAVFAAKGLGFNFMGWISIHGTTELFAVVLAGAGGFAIGWAVMFPGERSRLTAATAAGRQAGTVLAGVVVMLAVAGLLEGFARQLIQNDVARYGVGAAMLVFWLVYFYWPRRRAA